MSQIRLTPSTMREKAGKFRSEAEEVRLVIKRMDNLLNDLQTEWEGEAAVAFKNSFDELKPGFNKAQELIDDIAEKLDSSAAILQQTDNEIAKAVGQ